MNRSNRAARRDWELSSIEELQLHQLQAKQYWAGKTEKNDLNEQEWGEREEQSSLQSIIPDKWSLLGGLALYAWQRDCIEKWFTAGSSGTVKLLLEPARRFWRLVSWNAFRIK